MAHPHQHLAHPSKSAPPTALPDLAQTPVGMSHWHALVASADYSVASTAPTALWSPAPPSPTPLSPAGTAPPAEMDAGDLLPVYFADRVNHIADRVKASAVLPFEIAAPSSAHLLALVA